MVMPFSVRENQFHNGEEHPEGDAALEERPAIRPPMASPQGAVQPRLIDSVQGVGPHRNDQEGREIPHGLPGDIAAGLEGHFALQEEADDLGEDQRDERCQKVCNPAVGQVTAGDCR